MDVYAVFKLIKMTYDENLLVCLSEECDEVSQRACKAIRFGVDEVQEGQELSNAERIVYEFNDLFAVMEMILDRGLISKIIDRPAIELKKVKVLEGIRKSIEENCIVI